MVCVFGRYATFLALNFRTFRFIFGYAVVLSSKSLEGSEGHSTVVVLEEPIEYELIY